MGKNNLFVKFFYGPFTYTTITQDNAGANATWELGEQCASVFDYKDISQHQVKLEVWNEKKFSTNTLIGKIYL